MGFGISLKSPLMMTASIFIGNSVFEEEEKKLWEEKNDTFPVMGEHSIIHKCSKLLKG